MFDAKFEHGVWSHVGCACITALHCLWVQQSLRFCGCVYTSPVPASNCNSCSVHYIGRCKGEETLFRRENIIHVPVPCTRAVRPWFCSHDPNSAQPGHSTRASSLGRGTLIIAMQVHGHPCFVLLCQGCLPPMKLGVV